MAQDHLPQRWEEKYACHVATTNLGQARNDQIFPSCPLVLLFLWVVNLEFLRLRTHFLLLRLLNQLRE